MAIADLQPGHHAEEVRNHWWWRPGWHQGRRFYAFHITFDHHAQLTQMVNAYRHALRYVDQLTVIPDEWLHITVQGVGFTDEVAETALEQVLGEAAQRLAVATPPEVTLREVVVGDEAIALLATPAHPLARIRTELRAAISTALGADRVPEDGQRFRPHLSLAYVEEAGPAAPLVAAVAGVPAEPTTVRITEVSLIEMHRDHRMYQWETVQALPVGTSCP